MEYMDDPTHITECPHAIDWETDRFHLDDDNNESLPAPRLKTAKVQDFSKHQLIPYHSKSQFMIGVRDQQEVADQFLT
jgi:hypothetical protein